MPIKPINPLKKYLLHRPVYANQLITPQLNSDPPQLRYQQI